MGDCNRALLGGEERQEVANETHNRVFGSASMVPRPAIPLSLAAPSTSPGFPMARSPRTESARSRDRAPPNQEMSCR
jgi:hypothetical protein